MIAYLEEMLRAYVHILPLEVFVLVASIVEEIIAPIPSPSVMMLAGSFAFIQDYVLWGLLPLAVIGAVGKTIGGLVVYGISDRAEDVIMNTFGKFFGVTHEDIERLGRKLQGGARDYVLLTFLRALPIVPSVILSVGGGVLKVRLPLFIFSTFVGTIFRDGLYLYAGYTGITFFVNLIADAGHIEGYVQIGVVLLVLGFIAYRKFVAARV